MCDVHASDSVASRYVMRVTDMKHKLISIIVVYLTYIVRYVWQVYLIIDTYITL